MNSSQGILMRSKTKRFFLFAFLPLLALASCATEYQKEGVFTNGYSEFRLSPGVYVVTYRANEFTDPEKVMEFALKRAAEITRKKGYRYFTLIDTKNLPHYPSIRITIQCFAEKPQDRESIDASQLLSV